MIQIKITLLYHPSIQYLKEEKIWRKKTSNTERDTIDCLNSHPKWASFDPFFSRFCHKPVGFNQQKNSK